jgi:3-hydroxyisobutyrate dehydrogenase-like beta-hydroxyacid dehydrogenase
MGQPIADRLIAAGNEVSICSRSMSARVQALVDRGATLRETPGELATGADVVLTALPTEDSVRAVYAEMSAAAVAGQLYADHSTVSIELNRWCAETLRARQASFLDAPVSGGPAGAEAGTLTVMVGGDEETFNRALPVFQQFGRTIRLCGPVGGGQAVKLVNQLLVAVHTMAASEGAALAVQLGADLGVVQDVIGTSFGSSAMLLRNLPRFIARDFSPATPVGLIAKDLSIIHSEAVHAGVPLLLGGLVEQCFLEAKARGWTDEDMSALVKFWDRSAGSSPAETGD